MHSSDIRLNLRKVKTGILPISVGIYGALDYGRVCIDNDESEKWHHSYGGRIFLVGVDMITANFSALIVLMEFD